MFIMDNCSVNVALKVNKVWVKSRIKILTIVSYCPNLNPIKKATLSIK